MKNHYKTLGLNGSASAQEIRRAYRVLARRYHPDVNPGKTSEDRFKEIAEAYSVLSDPEQRKKYDVEYERLILTEPFFGANKAHSAYARASAAGTGAKKQAGRMAADFHKPKHENFGKQRPSAAFEAPKPEPKAKLSFASLLKSATGLFAKPEVHERRRGPARAGQIKRPQAARPPPPPPPKSEQKTEQAPPKKKEEAQAASVQRISVIELSISIRDAIYGVRKSIELEEPDGPRKISIVIPPGVRTGSVLRLRDRQDSAEELVLIIRVASHPFLSIQNRGLVAEIPVTLNEAISGANIKVPTLEEPEMIKLSPATQSGHEVRLKGKGISQRDGTRGDLFIRLMIHVPEAAEAVGLKEKAAELELYYGAGLRDALPKTLLD